MSRRTFGTPNADDLILTQRAATVSKAVDRTSFTYVESPVATPGQSDLLNPSPHTRSTFDEVAKSLQQITSNARTDTTFDSRYDLFPPSSQQSQAVDLPPMSSQVFGEPPDPFLRMPSTESAFLPLSQLRDAPALQTASRYRPIQELGAAAAAAATAPPMAAAAAAVPPVAAAAAPFVMPAALPVIVPFDARLGSDRLHAQCNAYRSILASLDCLYMTNVSDHVIIDQMQRAFDAELYDFDHTLSARARVIAASIANEQHWIDHAFWVTRHFFTERRFPVPSVRADMVRSFFIISMRLFFVEGGVSHRLNPTPHFNAATGTIQTVRRTQKLKNYKDIGFLPTSMAATTRFRIGAATVDWPAQVAIDDLWEHDICALFVLVPEMVTAVVMEPGQHTNAAEFRRLLNNKTFWPAVRVGDELCVLVDECVRKIVKFQTLSYNGTTYGIDTLTTPYWPIVTAGAEPGRKKKRTRARRQADDDDDDEEEVPVNYPYAFNRCRRSDGSEFWLTPFAKWNVTETRTAFPTLLQRQLREQTPQQAAEINTSFERSELGRLYPHLYMSSTHRVNTLARYSSTAHVDAVGDHMKHKTSMVQRHLSGVSSA